MQSQTKEVRISGIGVSPGIAIGPVAFRAWAADAPSTEAIAPEQIDSEWARLESALDATRVEIRAIQERLAGEAGSPHDGIFEAHLLMLEDKSVLSEVRQIVEDELICIESAFHQVLDKYAIALSKIGDTYLSERSVDVHDVSRRVLRNLSGFGAMPHSSDPHILLAHDLTPSDTATMDRDFVLGFATEVGSPTSHTAIVARSLGIPAVVGLHHLPSATLWGGSVLLDGYAGLLIFNPSAETLASYDEIQARKAAADTRLAEYRSRKSRTKDGRLITLSANIEFLQEMAMVNKNGGDGVGLYRTEFFYLNDNGSLPTEDEQSANYTRVAQECGASGVIIRTFDLGGDKLFGSQSRAEPQPNPFLGWRGIRVSLDERDIFKTQLRAILRASAGNKVSVMYPMVSSLDELLEANRILDACKLELASEDIDFDSDIEIGVMIEVPSAALIARRLAREVDFFSFGTNDLVQYTLAVDRINEKVAQLYQPAHPAILQLMKMAIDAGHDQDVWSGVCGEMASDISILPLLVGLGVDELSVGAVQLPMVKFAIRQLNYQHCAALVEEVIELGEAREIHEKSTAMAKGCYPELFQ
ncbi:MAG: phosphotransferase system enzyme I (PtsI) [Verrucomicrobiales bacterium]|jgi:phosphotransferase system enzyme I (PtsI)